MTSQKMASSEDQECTEVKHETRELKDQNEKTKSELLAQMDALEGEVRELKHLLRQLVDQ